MRLFDKDLSQPKSFLSGTHRARSPADTVSWLLPKAGAAGITRLANVTGLDVIGVPVWVSVRPNSRGLATSQGKGLTDDAAKASAMMESIESWHAETIDAPVRIRDYAAMARSAPAVDPQALSFYRDAPPRPDLAISWIEGFDLVSAAPRWVPLECVSTDYVVNSSGVLASTFVQSSNGLSGGNHLLEAISHGIAELIERHAISLNSERIRSFDPAIRVDPESVSDEGCRELLRRLDAAGLLVAIFELPSGLDVPVFACSIVDADEEKRWRTLPPFNGYGCHLDPGVSLARALTEAVQSRVTYIAGSRDDISASEYGRGGSPDDLRSFRALLTAKGAERSFDADAGGACASFEEDVARMIEALVRGGYDQVVAVDLSKEEIGVPVVKMVIPGLAAPEVLIRGRPIHSPPPRRAGSLQ
jgi:YcaO-like protein with predicted kinase domain